MTRIPKVGEVWLRKDNLYRSLKYTIHAVTDKFVVYLINGKESPHINYVDIPTVLSIDNFLKVFNPPKPEPREVWVTGPVYYDRSIQAFIGTKEELLKSMGVTNRPSAEWIRFREVLDDE